jgi:hypothetical protein
LTVYETLALHPLASDALRTALTDVIAKTVAGRGHGEDVGVRMIRACLASESLDQSVPLAVPAKSVLNDTVCVLLAEYGKDRGAALVHALRGAAQAARVGAGVECGWLLIGGTHRAV